MKYDKIKELMDHFEAFENETGSQEIASFAHWLHKRSLTEAYYQGPDLDQQLNERIVEELGKINNYTKHYVKKVTRESPLAGWNDMVAIIILYYAGSRRKTEVIQMGLMELSPGMEVVRRLLRLEMIEEFPDPDDGRARRIKLTEKGRKMYAEMEKEIRKLSKIMTGNLNMEEKQQLLLILEKLQKYHYPIWIEDQDASIDAILEKYELSK
ncbi:MAG: MarR family winged helix-turn-helix transcriptional regulator [Bacteroidota bacterium]